MDGLTEGDRIAKLFADKYRDLYTSAPCNESEMHDIVSGVLKALVGASSTAECLFNVNDGKSAMSRLKAHKSDDSSVVNFHLTIILTHAGNDFCIHVVCLFAAIAVDGIVPDSVRLSTVVPIPKGRNVINMSDSANFRGIASHKSLRITLASNPRRSSDASEILL